MARMKGVAAEVSYERKQEDSEGLATAREIVGKESADLWGRVKRMSVRDLASKFESGQAAANAAAAKVAQEVFAKIIVAVIYPHWPSLALMVKCLIREVVRSCIDSIVLSCVLVPTTLAET